ncbi:hypothetical protein AB0E01_09350 [Nocardia vinacea]|uniref:hypothetical protein n=1 Tax=Nocardia vinacea TaxID=96468 RepID=UPI00340537F8
MPVRRPSHRYAIPSGQLAKICQTATTTSDDPELDALILRLHIEPPAAEEVRSLCAHTTSTPTNAWCTCGTRTAPTGGNPVSPTLMRNLLDHAATRNSPSRGNCFATATESPSPHGVSTTSGGESATPCLGSRPKASARHTTLTWVERTFSYAVAREYSGHRGKASDATATYIKSHLQEVATALSILTAEPHPLVPRAPAAHTCALAR